MSTPKSSQEEARLQALRDLHILDTPPETLYDNLTQLAAELCQAPTALISLVDRDRQWFKSKVGLSAKETPRDIAFCDHAIRQPEALMVVPDATLDDRFKDNPLVTQAFGIRFYAGQPLRSIQGLALGTLCIIDDKPRQLSTRQQRTLSKLGQQVEALLQLRQAGQDVRCRLQEMEVKCARWEKLYTEAQNTLHTMKDPLQTLHTLSRSLVQNLKGQDQISAQSMVKISASLFPLVSK